MPVLRVFFLKHPSTGTTEDRILALSERRWIPSKRDLELVAEFSISALPADPAEAAKAETEALEIAWRRLQNMHEDCSTSDWTIDGKRRRSAMIGDIFAIDNCLWYADRIGFTKLPFELEQIYSPK